MHTHLHIPPHDLCAWRHSHDLDVAEAAERRTRWVVALTIVTMVVELAAGWLTGSMALLADGWHMATHAAALGVSAFAYRFARQHAANPRFTFGTGKVSSLAGYSSALLLGLAALWMAAESVVRLMQPALVIHYTEALWIATLGLAVNLASAWLLGHRHDHADHDHALSADHNLKAAYLHVLADALTSVLALAALGAGLMFGWAFLDPLMGIVGAAVVGRWAWGLAWDSAQALLDAEDHDEKAQRVRAAIESESGNRVTDLHLWRVGPAHYACIVSLVTHDSQPVEHYRKRVQRIPGIHHLTVEIHCCQDAHCLDAYRDPAGER